MDQKLYHPWILKPTRFVMKQTTLLSKKSVMLSIPLKKDTKRCQEKLKEGKTLILKQQKLIRMADREEDGWEVVRFYLSHDLASDSDDEKQLSKDRRRAACNKKKRKAYKHKHRKEQFRNAPSFFTGVLQ